MDDNEKTSFEIEIKEYFELNLSKFYQELQTAIKTNDLQSIYHLSKIFTRNHLKKLNN
jgi:hypothetical protein